MPYSFVSFSARLSAFSEFFAKCNATSQPHFAKATAVCEPIPPDAPVTSIFFIILIPGRGRLSSARSCVLHTIEHIVFKFKHIIDYIKSIFNEHKFLLKRAVKEKTALCLFYFLKLSLRLTLRLNTRCSGELSLLSIQK